MKDVFDIGNMYVILCEVNKVGAFLCFGKCAEIQDVNRRIQKRSEDKKSGRNKRKGECHEKR